MTENKCLKNKNDFFYEIRQKYVFLKLIIKILIAN